MQTKMIEGFRLSPQQRQLWKSGDDLSAYRARCVLLLEGNLRPALLEDALGVIARRHEILRTTYDYLPGMDTPIQVIAESPRLSYREIDRSGLDATGLETALEELYGEDDALPFDYQAGPLARFTLVKMSDEKSALLASLHALCADASTLKNLSQEISRAYMAALQDTELVSDEEALQYVQFSEWHNEILESAEAEVGKAFWQAQRDLDIASLQLPFENRTGGADAPALAAQSFASTLEASVFERAVRAAEERNVSLKIFLLACWQTWLWKMTAQPDIVVGTLFDGRKFDELQGTLGLFATYLPVHLRLDGSMRFGEVSEKLDIAAELAYEQQEYFTRERKESDEDSSSSIGFEFEEAMAEERGSGGGVRFSLHRLDVLLESFKLRLSAIQNGEGLTLKFHYDSSSYSRETVARFADGFKTLLHNILDKPEARLDELSVLSEEDLQQQIRLWNNTDAEFQRDVCLHTLFEAQCELSPNETACVFEDQELSFVELNRRANQLAHYLQRLGVGTETLAGIYMERSVEMIVALLGVLKAGGAYLPIDPSYPPERVKFMLADAQAAVLLTQDHLLGTLPEYAGHVVSPGRDGEQIALESEANPSRAVWPENLAYVIYTSGSTGTPKGAMIQHRSLINLLTALKSAIYSNHEPHLRVSVNAPLAFDGSVKQLVQLVHGHTLHIIPDEIRPDGAALLAYLQQRRIDVFDCTPSQLRLLLEAGLSDNAKDAPSFMLIGGEALDEAAWATLSGYSAKSFYNVYGPTECTVDATACRITPDQRKPTIGRPLGNVRAYLLDAHMRPLPAGLTGELYVGGAGVARGYLNQPALTAEKFLPDPFDAEPGARLYRTGDLARFLPDGNIEFIGRVDHQVKLRGLRIELGEIESVISQHRAVSEAVVDVREDTPGDMRLAAYVVPKQKYAATIAGRTRHELPNGMAIVHQGISELNYIYQEIFEDLSYMKYGVRLHPDACVFDVGANIGLFTLFVSQHCTNPRIYAFEPISDIFQTLSINSQLYGSNVKLFDYGLSDQEMTAHFTYYPHYSARSGMSEYADAVDEVEVIKKFLQNKEESGDTEMSELLAEGDDFLTGFFESVVEECRLRRLSDVIREQGVEHIDLLKVDVQRSELDVLRGLLDEDWKKIDQVVLEVHDAEGQKTEGRVQEILSLLHRQGFAAVAEQDELLKRTDRYNIYAVKPGLLNDKTVTTLDQGQPLSLAGEISANGHESTYGIALNPGDSIFDVTSSGMPHSLSLGGHYTDVNVYAFEINHNRFEPVAGSPRVKINAGGLSEALALHSIENLDLLKLDAETEALHVFQNLPEADWKRIRQVVVRLKDIDGQLALVTTLLTQHGFHIILKFDGMIDGIHIYTIYGRSQKSDRRFLTDSHAAEFPQRRIESFSPLSVSELRAHAREKLPEYMIPAYFILLDEVPLNANGKLDRQALPAPELAARSATDEAMAAANPIEEMLIGIWMEVLGVSEVGRHDNFFELGGHSLLATQLISRIREAFSIEMPLRSLFEAPTVAGLAALVGKRLKSGEAEALRPNIERVERNADLPLSFAQQRLWFMNQLEPDSPFYNCPGSVRLAGRLDTAALEKTLSEVVSRHEVLRTSFPSIDGQPVQVISPPGRFSLPLVDLGDLPEQERQEAARRLATEEALRPFDLASQPPLRAKLLRLAEQDHVLLFTMHHIISDGWSMGVMVREVTTLYELFLGGQPSTLPELPVQYADYAVWQRELLQGETLESHLAYWRTQLGGAPPLLELPTDRPRPPVQSYRGSSHTFALPAELNEGLRRLSRSAGVTLFMTCLAAFQTLLYRYTGQEDISVGTDNAGRTRAEIEGLIGFFVNALVMRTQVRGHESFREHVKRVKDVALGAYAHQEMPFEKLVEELNPERSLSYSPLFQVSFNLNNAPREALSLEGVGLSSIGIKGNIAKFDLTLSLVEGADRLFGSFEYNTDLFDAATIERMSAHFQHLLEAIVADPERPLDTLSMLSAEEQHRLLVEWNDTATEYPRHLCIHQLFEQQVERTPDAIALVFEEQQLTYAQLNERANQLARHLRSLGVGTETLVGILMERSVEMVVSLLAVLKAGGAYLPLDAQYPVERLSFMLDDASAPVLLTQEHLRGSVGQYTGHVLSVDRQWADIAVQSGANLTDVEREMNAENLAYVIYTSGSTGRPKGSLTTHRALVNFTQAMCRELALRETDRILQFASFSFDVFVEEVWPTWAAGATLIMVREVEELLGGQGLSRLITAQAITGCELPAPFWHEWVREMVAERGEAVVPPTLRFVMVGCEKADAVRVRQWQASGREMVVVFGLTETTITSTLYKVGAEREIAAVGELPVGRPIANTSVYVVDAGLNPVPVGVAGELYIGGEGVGRGYLNRAELTAERFVPNPFSREAGARLYRTGDVARYLADGNIEFLGRADEQVKVRGFRVELGEVEGVLGTHPLVHESVVVVRENRAAEKQLVAYVVALEATLSGKQLREHVRQHLPEYMVPAQFVMLEALPLTPNGKVDRRALPEPEPMIGEDYIAPRTPTEEMLCGIWCAVLGVERVGIRDNFFEVGGHSLLATQLVSRVRELFAVELALRTVFESPTVAELAVEVEELRGATQRTTAVPPLVRVSREESLPLSFAQERLWFLDQLEPNSPFYNVATGVRLKGRLSVEALTRTLNEVVRRHEVLRTSFPMLDGQPVQIISPAEDVPWVLTDLSALPEDERFAAAHRLSAEEAQQPFNLMGGSLLRARLIKLDEEDHVALLVMHHIISDGWSMGVLLDEVTTLYAALSKAEPSPLAELPLQYADYAVWQRNWLSGEALESRLGYWTQQLSGAPPALEIPTDYPRPAIQTYRGASRSFMFSPELSAKLKQTSRRDGVTLYMTLLAAFQTLLYRYTGQEDIVVGTPIAGRNRLETEGLIGFFVNTLLLRSRLTNDKSFRALLREVRDTTLDAYAHQDVPFEKLVEELQPERDLSRQPLFQVLFSLENTPSRSQELPELSVTPFGSDSLSAKFDLTLDMMEVGDHIGGSLRYNIDLFNADTIEKMTAHFQCLLESIVSQPEQSISQLQMLSAEEQHRLLVEWNDTATDYPRHLCIHQLFEQQVERTPDAIALVFEEQQLTYAQLNERANQLARHLRSLGVGTETLVGILMERSTEMIVSLLAVLKAGGAYLPLDAQYPVERLSFMLEDASAPVLLTQEHLRGAVGEYTGHVLSVDRQWAEINIQNVENVESVSSAENLAYVIYTSGSTGTPKGVAITHRGISRLVCNTNYIHLTQSSIVAQLANTSFDAATFELWGPLTHGGRVVGIYKDVALSPRALAEHLRQHAVSTIFLTTALFNQCAREEPSAFNTVKEVLFGGEAVGVEWVRAVQAQGGPQRLLHVYGPTESTTFATWHEVGEIEREALTIAIGGPLSNTQTYILDAGLSVVPAGVTGELYLGGDGLARGYLNRPALTAERFVPHPFSREAGARLYRTGDVARYLADGNIEFLGRVDQQVKIRGFRIEMGEVEAALGQHAGVRDAVVIVRGEGEEKALVAYVVAQDEAEVSSKELREHLRERLPEYMLPAQFVMLDALPLTPNGKVDRRALPAPEQAGGEDGAQHVAPRTPTEEMLCGIWREVLRVERVGIHNNFFEVGGHSLLATQLVSRVRELFAVELALRTVFESPTVAELAVEVEELRGAAERAVVPPLVRVEREESLPLSFAQQRLWFLQQLEEDSTAYNIPLAVRLTGPLDVSALARCLNHIVERHEALRTTFGIEGGEAVQQIQERTSLEVPLEDLSEAGDAGERARRARELADEEAGRAFDLRQGPLLRARLVRLQEQEHVLLLTMHHIISDGWSMGVLVKEVTTLYSAYARGEEATLPALPIQYADYAVWQRNWLQGDVLEGEIQYWKRQLADALTLQLPTDHPRPLIQSYRGASQSVVLGEELVRGFKELCQKEGVTLFMGLLAAFQILLSRYAGQEEISVGTPIANRTRGEVENLIGFFVNTLVLRTKVVEEESFKELLRDVRETTLDAYAHQDLPFERLVEEMQPERKLDQTPLFQVMFILQNTPREEGGGGESGLQMSAFGSNETTAKFDMTLNLFEAGEKIGGSLEYKVDLFEHTTIVKMIEHFERLLVSLVAQPGVPLKQLSLLSEQEGRSLLAATEISELDETFSF